MYSSRRARFANIVAPLESPPRGVKRDARVHVPALVDHLRHERVDVENVRRKVRRRRGGEVSSERVVGRASPSQKHRRQKTTAGRFDRRPFPPRRTRRGAHQKPIFEGFRFSGARARERSQDAFARVFVEGRKRRAEDDRVVRERSRKQSLPRRHLARGGHGLAARPRGRPSSSRARLTASTRRHRTARTLQSTCAAVSARNTNHWDEGDSAVTRATKTPRRNQTRSSPSPATLLSRRRPRRCARERSASSARRGSRRRRRRTPRGPGSPRTPSR